MSAPSFTRGPWTVESRSEDQMVRSVVSDKISIEDFPFEINMPSPPFALGACGALVASKYSAKDGDAEANAYLISAAPDMYAALVDVQWANGGLCPQCARVQWKGHQPKCLIGVALKKAVQA
jgi:hypothetical protein